MLIFCVSHKTVLLWVLALALLFMVVSGMFSACSTMFQGGTQVVLGTSFTAEDEDILGTDEDYTALENDLRSQVDHIEPPIRDMTSIVTLWMKSDTTLMNWHPI